jgi:bifunctional non-homologous end joining protein LigD
MGLGQTAKFRVDSARGVLVARREHVYRDLYQTAWPPGDNPTACFMKASRKPRRADAVDAALPEGARKAALPAALAPQLATLVEKAPADDANWQYEVKFDGYRLLARVDGADVRLFTRQGNDWTDRLRSLSDEIRALGIRDGWIDGEIVVIDRHGATDFQALQNAFETSRVDAIQFYAFDLPFYAGHDLRKVPLADRRALLRKLIENHRSPRLHFSDSFDASPDELLAAICRMKLEGLIGKRIDAPYVSARARTWIKLKCRKRQEFVIGGFTDPKGSRSGLGALLLGVHDAQGKLHYAGNVGTGFDTAMLDRLRRRLDPLRTTKAPFEDLPRDIQGHWVRPKLVAEVSFGEWTREGRVRHAVFHALRDDKDARAVTMEAPAPSGPASDPAPRHTSTSTIAVSHAARVIDKSTGLTKGDLANYYASAAGLMLPHLQGRPVALLRAPSGIDGEQFFQRHAETLSFKGVKALDAGLWPGHPSLIEITTEAGIVAAAQLNVVEFHTWNAYARNFGKPNRLIFDIDPGEGVEWPRIQEAASLIKALLDALELKSFLKTSGGKGLHVVVPLAVRAGWDEARDFARDVVVHAAKTIPDRFVAKSGPRNRVGKIFIDYLRNGIGATTAAAFTVRARPGLGVSMPVTWDELPELSSSAQWTIANADARLAEIARRNPWDGYNSVRQTLTRARRLLDGN